MSTPWFLPAPLIDITALALWWGLLKLSRRRDNRRLRNGILFLLLAGSTVRALLHLASLIPALTIPVGLGGVAFFLLIALMPFLLMFNGVVLIRREGRRLSNLLCLAAGLALIATPVAAVRPGGHRQPVGPLARRPHVLRLRLPGASSSSSS